MWNPKQNNLYQTCKNTYIRTSCRAFVSMWFSLGGRRLFLFCFILFRFVGGCIFFPLEWVGGCFWYFIFFYQDFFSPVSRIGHISSSCLLPHEKWLRNHRLLTVFTGICLLLSYRYHLCILVKIAWTVHPPQEGLLQYLNQDKDLYEKGQHFSLPIPLFQSHFLLFFGSVFHFDLCQHIFTNSFILSVILISQLG